MKFFDLEMNSCMAGLSTKDGRSVSYAEGTTNCKYYKYKGGINHNMCMQDLWHDDQNEECTMIYVEKRKNAR